MPSFQLSPGVVVDPDRDEAYVMSAEGGIVALDLAEGTPVWRTGNADKPLGVAGELLIGQAETPEPGNTLRIVTLDIAHRGEQVNETLVELPEGVQPAVTPSTNRSFTAEAQPEAGGATVSWEFVERPLQGLAPGPVEVLPGEAPPTVSTAEVPVSPPSVAAPFPSDVPEPGAEATVVRGVARVDLPSGAVTATEAARVPPVSARRAAPGSDTAPATDLAPDAMLPGVPQPQFLSADERHVLSSQRIAADPVWEKYLWTIFERASGRRVGGLRMHLRYVPFFVSGTRVIYVTPPHARREEPTIVEEPPQLHAADLDTGAQVWIQPVGDSVDREPPPP